MKVQVFVKTMDGKTITMGVLPTDAVASFKAAVEQKTGVPAKDQVLNFAGKILGKNMLKDYGVSSVNTLFFCSFIIIHAHRNLQSS